MYRDLKTISRYDDERVREQAGLIAKSIRKKGDFSEARVVVEDS
jgi:hypothetical protein